MNSIHVGRAANFKASKIILPLSSDQSHQSLRFKIIPIHFILLKVQLPYQNSHEAPSYQLPTRDRISSRKPKNNKIM